MVDLSVLVRQLQQPAEAWHVVGNAGEPAYLNGWVSLGGAQPPARFYKDLSGEVHVQAAVKNGTPDTNIFQLPVGYRPAFAQIGSCRNGATGSIFGLSVDAAGNVTTLNTGANANIAFTMSFRAEQ